MGLIKTKTDNALAEDFPQGRFYIKNPLCRLFVRQE